MVLASGAHRILKAVKCLYAVSILKYLGLDAKKNICIENPIILFAKKIEA